jgi:hypothetical protein
MSRRLALALALPLLAAAPAARAEEAPRPVAVTPLAGAFVPVGGNREVLEDAPLAGVQAVFDLHPNVGLVGAFAWSAPGAKRLGGASLDLLQYDLGLRAQQTFAAGAGVTLRPFAGAGFGGRTLRFDDDRLQDETGFAWYVGGGAELGWRALSAGVTARHEMHTPNGTALGDSTRHDVLLFATAGVRF